MPEAAHFVYHRTRFAERRTQRCTGNGVTIIRTRGEHKSVTHFYKRNVFLICDCDQNTGASFHARMAESPHVMFYPIPGSPDTSHITTKLRYQQSEECSSSLAQNK